MREKLPILAVLQNQWFLDPEGMKQSLVVHFKDDYERFVETYLFFRCQTGKRLRKALMEGESVIPSKIVWTNSSREIGGKSSASFPGDPKHIISCLQKYQPTIVLLFGKTAQETWEHGDLIHFRVMHRWNPRLVVIPCCHPAARHKDVHFDLSRMAARLATAARERGYFNENQKVDVR